MVVGRRRSTVSLCRRLEWMIRTFLASPGERLDPRVESGLTAAKRELRFCVALQLSLDNRKRTPFVLTLTPG